MADGRQTRDTQAWPAEFTERRALEAHSNKFFLDNPLEKEWFLTFFKHSSISPLDFQILQKQFKGFKPEYLVQGIQGTETRKAAWIDQRCFPDDPKVPGAVRTKGTDLTAKDLWTQLQKPVSFVANLW